MDNSEDGWRERNGDLHDTPSSPAPPASNLTPIASNVIPNDLTFPENPVWSAISSYPVFEKLSQCSQVIVRNITGIRSRKLRELPDYEVTSTSGSVLLQSTDVPVQCEWPFEMVLLDGKEPIMELERPFALGFCCCPFSLDRIKVRASGSLLGSVQQDWTPITPFLGRLSVRNAAGEKKLQIISPPCPDCCCAEIFKVFDIASSCQVAELEKQSATDYLLSFTQCLDNWSKTLLMVAAILIDFLYYKNDWGPQRAKRLVPLEEDG